VMDKNDCHLFALIASSHLHTHGLDAVAHVPGYEGLLQRVTTKYLRDCRYMEAIRSILWPPSLRDRGSL